MYDILKCKNFLIGFLDELGNFKQKKFTFQNVILFLHFTAMDPIFCMPKAMLIPAEPREASKGPIELRNVKFLNLKSEISNGIF